MTEIIKMSKFNYRLIVVTSALVSLFVSLVFNMIVYGGFTQGKELAPTPESSIVKDVYITSIAPQIIIAGSQDFTLSVYGSNFTSSSVVYVNNLPKKTIMQPSQGGPGSFLTASVQAQDVKAGWTVEVYVINEVKNNNMYSNSLPLYIMKSNPPPTITSISPSSTTSEDNFTLTINGTDFNPLSYVVADFSHYNQGEYKAPTNYISPNQLTARIEGEKYGSVIGIKVVKPPMGGGESNIVTFAVNNPKPTITNIIPSSIDEGRPDLTLTVNGTGFVKGSVVSTGTLQKTTYVSENKLTAIIPNSYFKGSGQFNIFVVNPSPGGGDSNSVTLFVLPTKP